MYRSRRRISTRDKARLGQVHGSLDQSGVQLRQRPCLVAPPGGARTGDFKSHKSWTASVGPWTQSLVPATAPLVPATAPVGPVTAPVGPATAPVGPATAPGGQRLRQWGQRLRQWGQRLSRWGQRLSQWGQRLSQLGQRLKCWPTNCARGLAAPAPRPSGQRFYEPKSPPRISASAPPLLSRPKNRSVNRPARHAEARSTAAMRWRVGRHGWFRHSPDGALRAGPRQRWRRAT